MTIRNGDAVHGWEEALTQSLVVENRRTGRQFTIPFTELWKYAPPGDYTSAPVRRYIGEQMARQWGESNRE